MSCTRIYEIDLLNVDKMVFFIRRVDEVADVVSLYTILLLGFSSAMAYTILKELDRGDSIIIRDDKANVWFDINVITPLGPDEDVADRTYGFDLSRVS